MAGDPARGPGLPQAEDPIVTVIRLYPGIKERLNQEYMLSLLTANRAVQAIVTIIVVIVGCAGITIAGVLSALYSSSISATKSRMDEMEVRAKATITNLDAMLAAQTLRDKSAEQEHKERLAKFDENEKHRLESLAKNAQSHPHVRTGTILYELTTGKEHMKTSDPIVFDMPITHAWAVLTGVHHYFKHGNGDVYDKPFGESSAIVTAEILPDKKSVKVHGKLTLRDGTGIYDDEYGGYIHYAVIVE